MLLVFMFRCYLYTRKMRTNMVCKNRTADNTWTGPTRLATHLQWPQWRKKDKKTTVTRPIYMMITTNFVFDHFGPNITKTILPGVAYWSIRGQIHVLNIARS